MRARPSNPVCQFIVLASLALLAGGCGRVDPLWKSPAAKRPVRADESLPADIIELRQEAETNPQPADNLVRLAVAYLQHDRFREAADAYERAVRADPQNADALLGLWRLRALLSDGAGVVAFADRAAQANPQDPAARPVVVEAATVLDQVLNVRPSDPWLLLNAALCQTKLRNYNRAEEYAQRAAAAAPYALTPRLMLGTLYLEQGLLPQAAEELRRLADQQPNNALIREALGRVWRADGNWEDAVTEFAAAQRLQPGWLVPYLNAGDAYMHLNDYARAAEQFAKALKLVPQSLPAGLNLVQALAGQRNYAAALAECEKMLKLYPDQPTLLNNVAYLLAQKGSDLDRAISITRQLVKRYPGNAVILDTAGWVNLRVGNADEAVRLLQQATQLTPNNPMSVYHLGKAQLAANRRTEAVQSLQAALTLGLPVEEKRDAESALAGR